MKKILAVVIALIITSSFSACEGYTMANGVVYDAETKLPLDSVCCKRIQDSHVEYTNTKGVYDMRSVFGGCLPDCPGLDVQFSKSGYVAQEYRNFNGKDIYLKRQNYER